MLLLLVELFLLKLQSLSSFLLIKVDLNPNSLLNFENQLQNITLEHRRITIHQSILFHSHGISFNSIYSVVVQSVKMIFQVQPTGIEQIPINQVRI